MFLRRFVRLLALCYLPFTILIILVIIAGAVNSDTPELWERRFALAVLCCYLITGLAAVTDGRDD